MGCGFLISIPAAAGTPSIAEVNYAVKKEAPKKKKTVKAPRKVIRLDFDKKDAKAAKKTAVAPKAKKQIKPVAKVLKPAKKAVVKKTAKKVDKKIINKKVAKVKNKKNYWSMHCLDGFVVKNQVYCSNTAQKPMLKKKVAKTTAIKR